VPGPSSPTPHRFDGTGATVGADVDDGEDDDDDDGEDDLPFRAGVWDRDLLVSRYGPRRAGELLTLVGGRPAPHRRVGVVPAVLAVLVAIGLTYAVWAHRSAGTGTVGATLIRIETDSDHSVVVTWTISRDPGTTVSCEVTATDGQGADVGLNAVTVSPGPDRATQLITQVQTTRRGLDATVDRCRRVTPAHAATPGGAG